MIRRLASGSLLCWMNLGLLTSSRNNYLVLTVRTADHTLAAHSGSTTSTNRVSNPANRCGVSTLGE